MNNNTGTYIKLYGWDCSKVNDLFPREKLFWMHDKVSEIY